MSDYLKIDALLNGIIYSDNSTKQDLGRRFAAYPGLNPGPAGPDGGVDGYGELDGRKIYFQSKLHSKPLGLEFADTLYANLNFHQSDTGIMLAGIGYTQEFERRLSKFHDIHKSTIHLLTLQDMFGETPTFEKAVKDLPPLRDLRGGAWKNLS